MAADAVAIRPALPNDAAGLAMLANALDRDQGGEGKVHSEATVLRAAFAAEPAVRFVVATQAAEPVGYAMFARFYNSDTAETGSYLNDLYVIPALRSAGIGRRLLAAVAAATAQAGGSFIWTGVYSANTRARAFYAALGARDEDARILELDGAAFASLARGAEKAAGAGAHPCRRRIASLPWTSRHDPPDNREGASKRPCRTRRRWRIV